MPGYYIDNGYPGFFYDLYFQLGSFLCFSLKKATIMYLHILKLLIVDILIAYLLFWYAFCFSKSHKEDS